MTMGAPQSQARSGWYRLAALAALSPAFWLLIASSSVTAERFALVNLTKSAPSNADITDASSAFVQALSNASGSYKIAIGSRNLCARLIAPPSARLIAPPSPDKVATAWSCQSWSTALQPPPDGPISVMATPAGPEGDSTDASADAEGDVTIYSVGPMEPPMNRLLRQVAHSLDGLQYALVTVPIAATFTGLAFGYLALSFIKTLNPSIALVAAAIAMSTSFVAFLISIVVLVASSDVAFQGIFGLAATSASFGASLGSVLTALILCFIAVVLHWRVYALERLEPPIDLEPSTPIQSIVIEQRASRPISQPRLPKVLHLPESVISVEVDTVETPSDEKK